MIHIPNYHRNKRHSRRSTKVSSSASRGARVSEDTIYDAVVKVLKTKHRVWLNQLKRLTEAALGLAEVSRKAIVKALKRLETNSLVILDLGDTKVMVTDVFLARDARRFSAAFLSGENIQEAMGAV